MVRPADWGQGLDGGVAVRGVCHLHGGESAGQGREGAHAQSVTPFCSRFVSISFSYPEPTRPTTKRRALATSKTESSESLCIVRSFFMTHLKSDTARTVRFAVALVY